MIRTVALAMLARVVLARVVLALTAEQAAVWAALAASVVGSIAAGIIAVIGALKGQAGKTASEETSRRVDSQGQSIKALRTDLTTVALNTPTATAAGEPDGPDVYRGPRPPTLSGLVNPNDPTGGT